MSKFKKSKSSTLSKPAKKEVKETVYRAIKTMSETKYTGVQIPVFDQLTTGNPVDVTAAIGQSLNGQGRVGDEIRIQKIEWVANSVITGATDGIGRYILFRYRGESLGAPPSRFDVLDNGPSGIPDVNSLYNYNNRKSYVILADVKKFFTIGPSATNRAMAFTKTVYGKKLDFATQYDIGSAGGYNHVYVLFIGAASTSPSLRTASTVRIYWKDS